MITISPKKIVILLLRDNLSGNVQMNYVMLSVLVSATIFYFPFLPCMAVSKWFLLEIIIVFPMMLISLYRLSQMTPFPNDFARDFICLCGSVALLTIIPVYLLLAVIIKLTDPLVYKINKDNYDLLYEVLDATLAFGDVLAVFLFFFVMKRVFLYYGEKGG